jgi:predicted ATPase
MNIDGQNIFLRAIRNEHIPSVDDSYPFNLPIVRNLKTLEFSKSVTYIVGENGSGKSTLLEAIATLLGLNAEGGSRNFNFRTQETHSSLYKELRAVRADLNYKNAFFFRAESFYNVASEVDRIANDDRHMLDSYGGISLHEQSHGESFMALFTNRLRNKGLYIFDEPEAALSYTNQLRFLVWMKDAISEGSQIIISTHSPVILAYPDAEIYVAEDGILNKSSYNDCYIYRDMLSFVMNKDLVLKELLSE